MIPTGTLIGPPCPLIAGDAFHLPVETFVRSSGGLVKAKFKINDVLTAAIYQRGVAAAIFAPTVTWYTAPDFATNAPTQTGYDQGEVEVHGTSTQAAKFRRGRSYYLAVTWSPTADPAESQTVAVIPLAIGSPY